MGFLTPLRYMSASTIVAAMFLHSQPHLFPYNVYIHMVGAMLWTIVGLSSKDRAILLNFAPQIPILGIGMIL
jgi:hypothetical protein